MQKLRHILVFLILFLCTSIECTFATPSNPHRQHDLYDARDSTVAPHELELISTSEPSAAPFSIDLSPEQLKRAAPPPPVPADELSSLKAELADARQRVKSVRKELKEARATADFHEQRVTRVTAQKRRVKEVNQNLKMWLIISVVVILACVCVAYFLVSTALSGISQPETWAESGRSGLGTREYALDYYQHQLAMYQHYISYLSSLGLTPAPPLAGDALGHGSAGYGSVASSVPLGLTLRANSVHEAPQSNSPMMQPQPYPGSAAGMPPLPITRTPSAYDPSFTLARAPSTHTAGVNPNGLAVAMSSPNAARSGIPGGVPPVSPFAVFPPLGPPVAIANVPTLLSRSFSSGGMPMGSQYAGTPRAYHVYPDNGGVSMGLPPMPAAAGTTPLQSTRTTQTPASPSTSLVSHISSTTSLPSYPAAEDTSTYQGTSQEMT